jgi:hypothetical protein
MRFLDTVFLFIGFPDESFAHVLFTTLVMHDGERTGFRSGEAPSDPAGKLLEPIAALRASLVESPIGIYLLEISLNSHC